jgi:hypothetical protein
MLRPKPWPCAVACSSGPRRQSAPRLCRGPPRGTARGIPSAVGVIALWGTVLPVCRRRRARVDRGALPPAERVEVLVRAPRKPADSPWPATRWSLDDRGAAFHQPSLHGTRSRSSLWRMLDAADRTPQRSVSWLHSHAPAVEAKARALASLEGHARRFYERGRVVLWADAKTGMQMLQRASPTPRGHPGKPATRAPADSRHGVRALLASVVVPTGPIGWQLGPTRPRADWAAHLANVVHQLPVRSRYEWGVEKLTTHWRRAGGRLVAPWGAGPCTPTALRRGAQRRACLSDPTPKPGFHLTPTHGSWLKQVAWGFRVFARRCLQRGACAAAQDCATRLCDALAGSNTPHAHP